jgi:hypothetical protein
MLAAMNAEAVCGQRERMHSAMTPALGPDSAPHRGVVDLGHSQLPRTARTVTLRLPYRSHRGWDGEKIRIGVP